jgi:hypothetical protein
MSWHVISVVLMDSYNAQGESHSLRELLKRSNDASATCDLLQVCCFLVNTAVFLSLGFRSRKDAQCTPSR